MTNRTIQLHSHGFSATPVTVTVTLDGTVVFDGEIPTTDQPAPELPLPTYNLDPMANSFITFELPVGFGGQKSISCTVANGQVMFAYNTTNYCKIPNPIWTTEQMAVLGDPTSSRQACYDIVSPVANPPFTQEETNLLLDHETPQSVFYPILVAHNVPNFISSGPDVYRSVYPGNSRTNVEIDGIPQDAGIVVPDAPTGDGWYLINNGSTFSYTLNVHPGFA